MSKTTINFITSTLTINNLQNKTVLASLECKSKKHCLYTYTDDYWIGYIDLNTQEYIPLISCESQQYPKASAFCLYESDDGDYVALTCTYSPRGGGEEQPVSQGLVIDTKKATQIMVLENSDYHTHQSLFPVCFAKHKGRNVLVHATDWCRLDITDLESLQCLTERDQENSPELDVDDDDYVFTEWAGELKASPSGHRVATIGWVWHPVGHAYSFHLEKWLNGSIWESDQSPHQKSYAMWTYFWDSPFFWIDDQTLCIWGAGKQDGNDIPEDCAAIFNAETEEKLYSFSGPTMDLFIYDKYLFSGIRDGKDKQLGVSVWCLQTGERLHDELGLRVDCYLYQSSTIVNFEEDGVIQWASWQD